jgi:hypothetical protein
MMKSMKSSSTFGLSALLLGSAIGVTAFAQSGAATTQTTDPAAASSSQSTMNPADKSTYATGKPLEQQSKEGFWGSGSIARSPPSRIRSMSLISSSPRMLAISRM